MDAWKRTGTGRRGELRLSEGSTPQLCKVQKGTWFLEAADAVCLVLMDPRLGSHGQTFSFHGATSIFLALSCVMLREFNISHPF